MKNFKFFYPVLLFAFALLTVQCTTSSTPDDVPVEDVQNTDLLGLQAAYTNTVVAGFTEGVPTVSLDLAEVESMYRQVALTTQKLEGTLVNYYVEAKEGGPLGRDYFLILNGELSDGTYMKSGFLLAPTDGGMTVALRGRDRPVPHFSCRADICNNCEYVYNLSGRIDCGCSFGINDCYKYYPDQDPT